MQVSEIMSPHSLTATPDRTIRDAAEIMQRMDTGFLPIGENDRLVGTVTDRDIVVKGIAKDKTSDSPLRDVMSTDVLFCYDDQEVAEVARNMGDCQVRRMPVVDRDKRLVGVISLGDLSAHGDPSAAGVALEDISA